MKTIIKKLINDAFKMNGQGGVSTIPLIDGTIMTNYVPFRKYFMKSGFRYSRAKRAMKVEK